MGQRPGFLHFLPSWRRLDATARWLVPFALLVFGLFLLGMPFGIPDQAVLPPLYAMGCVYFWSLYRPASLPAPLIALSGILLDLLGLSPLGLWAVLLLLLKALTFALRRYLVPASFIWVWAGFVLLAGAGAILSWAVACATHQTLLSGSQILLEVLLAAALYPALSALLIRVHRGPAAIERA